MRYALIKSSTALASRPLPLHHLFVSFLKLFLRAPKNLAPNCNWRFEKLFTSGKVAALGITSIGRENEWGTRRVSQNGFSFETAAGLSC
jgi:hypothetical protein